MSAPPPPQQRRKYSENVFKKWKLESPWIENHPSEEDLIICKPCGMQITPTHSRIIRHGNSNNHRLICRSQSKSLPALLQPTVFQTIDAKTESISVEVDQIPIKIIGTQNEEINFEVVESVIDQGQSAFTSFTHIKANGSFPNNIKSEMARSFLSGQGWDTVWKCQDGSFKVHKFVLALFSPYLRRLMDDGDTECFISTPELNLAILRSILCLFYTGSVVVSSGSQGMEIEKTLTFLECNSFGSLVIDDHVPQDQVLFDAFDYDNVPHPPRPSPRKKPKLGNMAVEPLVDEAMTSYINDDEMHVVYEDDYDYEPDTRVRKRERKKSRKLLEAEEAIDKIKIEVDEDYMNSDKENIFDFLNENRIRKERFVDTKTRFYLKGNRQGAKKGVLSRDLGTDLFDDAPEHLLSISVCRLCYLPFKSKVGFMNHYEEEHDDEEKKTNGPCYISKNKYCCPTCKQEISVGHIIWFVKHMRFCGKDDDKAKAVLQLGQDDVPIEKDVIDKDPLDEDMVFATRKVNGPKIRALAKFLTGQECDTIWGCRNCYDAFKSKELLREHITSNHNGKFEHGSCYDEINKQYTCMYCNLSKKYRHLVYFIRHTRQCGVNPKLISMQTNEEEGVDEDSQDVVDPWGVVNKPLKVVNLRSHWIAEALFGRYVPIVFPCHVCYNAFTSTHDLKEHFSSEHHPDTVNTLENGEYYNKSTDSYNCPVCKKDLCKKQRNSIYFTYHLKKCLGKTYPVIKSCDKCNKSFNSFGNFSSHQTNNCDTKEFICHICSRVLKSRTFLHRHVREVHSENKPFMCPICPMTFKRKGDLKLHEESHNTTLSFSCEQCGKAFKGRTHLNRHTREVHRKYEDKPYQCSHCPMRFVRKLKMMDHLATHGLLPSFQCDLCSSEHKTRESLRVHRKKVHNVTGRIPNKNNPPPPSLPNEADLVQIEILPESMTTTVEGDEVPAPTIAYTMSYKKNTRKRSRKKK